MKSIRTRRRKPPEGGCVGQAVWRDRWKHRVIPAGAAGGVWNPIGNTRAKIIRRKRGSVMREERNIECMNLRSQHKQRLRELEAEQEQWYEHLEFMTKLLMMAAAVAGGSTMTLLIVLRCLEVF